jgi:hypothetical protein
LGRSPYATSAISPVTEGALQNKGGINELARPSGTSLFDPAAGATACYPACALDPSATFPNEASAGAYSKSYQIVGNAMLLAEGVWRLGGWALGRGAAQAGVPLARALEAGLLKSGGKLAQVLGGIEKGYAAAGPKNALDALSLVKNATSSAGLEAGVATLGKTGEIVLQNVGGVTTTLGTNGSILVQRGSDVLLHLLP